MRSHRDDGNEIKKLSGILSLLLILLVIVVNLGLYFTYRLSDGMFLSDLLYLPALYKDVVEGGGLFANWTLTPAPYYFPDMPLYFISHLLTGNFYYAIALFFTLQSALLVYISYRIYTLFFDKITSFSLAAIALALLHLYPTMASNFMFVGTIHYGEFLVGLYVIYLTLIVLDSQRLERFSLLALLVLVAWTKASDASFTLHFVMPITLTLVILWAIKRAQSKQIVQLFVTFGAGIWIGKILHHPFSIDEKLVTGNNINALIEIVDAAFKDHTVDFVIGIGTLIIALASLLLKKRLSFFYDSYDASTKLMFLSLFLLLMTAGIVVVLALAPISIATRYMIPLFEIPVLLAPVYIGFLKLLNNTQLTKRILTAVAFAMLILVLIGAREKLHHGTLYSNYYPPLTQCVDHFVEETGASHGIATYWNAKPIYMTGKHPLTLAQVQYDLSPNTIISTSVWQQNKYDFAVIVNGDIDKKKILLINGKPDKIYPCDNAEILYYKNKMRTDPLVTPKATPRQSTFPPTPNENLIIYGHL